MMRKSMTGCAAVSSLVGAASFSLATEALAALPEGCARLGGALVEHSCFHAKYGPFVSVQTTSRENREGAPNVDPVHTEYRLGLSAEQSVVTYLPLRTGAWSLFLNNDVPLAVLDPEGRELDRVLSLEGATGCDALPIAHVYELSAKQRYELVLGPSSSREAVIVIEYVDDFLTANGRDRDADGYGDPADKVTTSCTPPEGYAPNASDCDDGDPDIHPGRAEDCDGTDQNCNGVVDDIGLTCWAGANACRTTGTWTCVDSAQAICDAVPAPESPETCNGVDDDCDGDIDDGNALCADGERPVCVRHERTASCGCLLDLDCGPADSGRLCDVARKRCVPGCSNERGRNGCPEGFECRTRDDDGAVCERIAGEANDGNGGNASVDDEARAPLDSRAGGCGCFLPGVSDRTSGASWLGALLGWLALRQRRSRTRRTRLPGATRVGFLSLVLSAATVCCGGKADLGDEEPRADLGGEPASCEPVLSEKPVIHACVHTTNGPFADVVASSDEGAAGDVSRLHHTFVVDRPGGEAFVIYEALRDGEHVLMTDRTVGLGVLDYRAEPVPGSTFAIDGCDTIAEGRSAELEKGRLYRFELEPERGEPFNLFIEHLGAFRDPWLRVCSR